ncbi:hypothetical protein C2869_02420 [Saccharobesus litoralis]|uniref:4-vinyl reductase 4VR domain-containing protein n=1 Tax=Saccharobesus litoralis TaxID=2172099 RepID=A0A2S0VMB4_9ALTE|nr:heme NO-binding domain-containing protein [Saccharobesus litoralis]AWB65363.1 hypothetical protein C2869_02420 [Saccharobesus litoralis]
MKGLVFNMLQEYVEQNVGYEAWDKAINSCDLPSQGIYISSESYNDSEIFSLVGHLSEALATPAADLVRSFGQFLFFHLLPLAPQAAKEAKDLKSFLVMVENIIHVEVLKLYQDANLPSFDYSSKNSQHMTMVYRSPRKLCHLSEGLILSAAEHFKQKINLHQSQCMHSGAEACHIEIEFL